MKTTSFKINYSNWLLLLLSLVTVTPGCKLTKPPAHTETLTKALPATTVIPSRWVAGNDSNAVNNDWLRSFNDPGLDSIVAEAIRNNPELKEAATIVEIAQQNVIVIASKMKLQVGVNIGYDVMLDDGNSGAFQSTKGLGLVAWEPSIWGKVRAQKASAEASYQADSLDFAYARQSLAATTAKCWYLTVETNKLEGIAKEVVKIYTELLNLVKTKRRLGKVSDLDVAEASSNLNAAEAALVKARGLVSESQRELEVLVGRYPSAEIKTAINFTALPPPINAGLPSLLLERRPDLLAAEKEVIATFRNEESARLALLPSFSLNIGGGRLSDKILAVLQLNPWMIAAGIGMSIPISTGGRLPAQIKIATAKQQAAVANYGKVVLNAFREVENGLMNEALLAERLQFEENVLVDRTEAVRIAQLKYTAGSIDLLSVLQLQNAQILSQVELIKLRNAQLTNRINLHLALGGSFE